MSGMSFAPGDHVNTPRLPGTVVDVRPTPSGKFIFGIEDETGEVTYFTERVLRRVES